MNTTEVAAQLPPFFGVKLHLFFQYERDLGRETVPTLVKKIHYSSLLFPALTILLSGAQWLSGRVLDSSPKGRGFEPRRRHCVEVLEQDILA